MTAEERQTKLPGYTDKPVKKKAKGEMAEA